MTRTLAVARAVTPLTAWNDEPRPTAGAEGRARGETEAANISKGPIITGTIMQCARHGYQPGKDCSEMDRSLVVASVDTLC